MISKNKREMGFTLIELIVVMIIISVLALFISGNFVTSLRKGRDARRKNDLYQIQRALEMYYQDQSGYPTFAQFPFGSHLCQNQPCQGADKDYMQKVPNDPANIPSDPSSNTYIYQTDATGTYYRLFSCLENDKDEGFNVSQTGFNGSPGSDPDCGRCGLCKFSIAATNITPYPAR